MPAFSLDPFKEVRKNSHIWRGERALLWYYELLDGSMRLIVLYECGGDKRRLMLEVDEKSKKVEFKSDSLGEVHYKNLVEEIEVMEQLLRQKEHE